jgi:hypothetical protein
VRLDALLTIGFQRILGILLYTQSSCRSNHNKILYKYRSIGIHN